MVYQINVFCKLLDLASEIGHGKLNSRQCSAINKAAHLIADELNKPHQPALPNMGVSEWIDCDEVGKSSRYLCEILTRAAGISLFRWLYSEHAFPNDPVDFGCCIGLLNAEPSLRQFLSVMKDGHGPQWLAIVMAWDELERLYSKAKIDGNFVPCYDRLRNLIEIAESSGIE